MPCHWPSQQGPSALWLLGPITQYFFIVILLSSILMIRTDSYACFRGFFFTSLTIQPITDHRYYMLYIILVVSRCEIFKALRHEYLLHIMSPVSFRLISKDVGLKTLHTRFLHHQYFPSLTTYLSPQNDATLTHILKKGDIHLLVYN